MILSKLIDPALWNLAFVRDICSAGMCCSASAWLWRQLVLSRSLLRRHGVQDTGAGSQAGLQAAGDDAGQPLPQLLICTLWVRQCLPLVLGPCARAACRADHDSLGLAGESEPEPNAISCCVSDIKVSCRFLSCAEPAAASVSPEQARLTALCRRAPVSDLLRLSWTWLTVLRLCTGPKAELMTGLLERFGLSSPASASHKLVFHYRMHDYIAAQWAGDLSPSHQQLRDVFSFCDRTLCTEQQLLPIQPWPLYGGSRGLVHRPAVTAAGRQVLAGIFGSWAEMQQAVAAARAAPGHSCMYNPML